MIEIDDHQLLAEFARDDYQAAFATLVERYVNLVYSVALRQTRNTHAAQEVTQAVFILLARKAGKLSPRTVVSGWLCQTARLTSANYLRTEYRRSQREHEAFMQSQVDDKTTDETWQSIAPLLDDALGKLGERDRNAIILRFLENKSLAQVGNVFGVSDDAAKMRVNRALEKLRKIFRNRGVTLTGTLIIDAVSANSVQTAPVGLEATITAMAVKGAMISATITTLMNGTMKTMTWLKLKFAAGVSITIIAVAGITTVALSEIGVADDGTTVGVILKKSMDAYASLTSYRSTGTIVSEMSGNKTTTKFNVVLARPDLYRIDWIQTHASLTSKGAVWSAGDGDFLQIENLNPQKQKNMEMAIASATGVSGGAAASIPGTFFNMNWGNSLKPLLLGQKQESAQVGGVDCYVLTTKVGGDGTLTIWIGKSDFLIHQIQQTSFTAPSLSNSQIKEKLITENNPSTSQANALTRKEIARAKARERSDKLRSLAAAGKLTEESIVQATPPAAGSTERVTIQTYENIIVNHEISPEDLSR